MQPPSDVEMAAPKYAAQFLPSDAMRSWCAYHQIMYMSGPVLLDE
jgi:hypothetical protein